MDIAMYDAKRQDPYAYESNPTSIKMVVLVTMIKDNPNRGC